MAVPSTGSYDIEQEIVNARKRNTDAGSSNVFGDASLPAPTATSLASAPEANYSYPGMSGTDGNFGGYEGVSGEGTPAPSPEQVQARGDWRLSRSGANPAGTDPRMAEIERAIASLKFLDPGSVYGGQGQALNLGGLGGFSA